MSLHHTFLSHLDMHKFKHTYRCNALGYIWGLKCKYTWTDQLWGRPVTQCDSHTFADWNRRVFLLYSQIFRQSLNWWKSHRQRKQKHALKKSNSLTPPGNPKAAQAKSCDSVRLRTLVNILKMISLLLRETLRGGIQLIPPPTSSPGGD